MLTHRIAFAALLFTVAACATDTTPEALEAREKARAAEVFADDPRRGEEVKKICFASQIDGFGETTDRAVVVREGRDHYLIETFPGCFDLDFAQSLAIDSFSSCLSKGDRIIAFDSVFAHSSHSRINRSCLVKTIYEWDRDAKDTETDETTDEDAEAEAEEIETAMLQ
ncbi:MAG: DUF6491 family protein [Pseudomonadota bacterium]